MKMTGRRATTRPVQLEVMIHSNQLQISTTTGGESGQRFWLVTVRAALGGQDVELGLVASGCDVTSDLAQLTVTYLGQPDEFSALYKVDETTPSSAAESITDSGLAIRVRLTPRYHPVATTVYRLDEKLAALVGRDYLAHPKYALSVVLAYARAKRLVTAKSILCDRRLEQLLGCPWIRNQAVWDRLAGLMTKVTEEAVSMEHRLQALDTAAVAGSSSSLAVMELSADAQRNLYPAKWIYNGVQSTMLERSRTTVELPAVAAVKSKKTLRRHKSI